jgi:D-lactate dehydrogenase
MRVAVFSTKSYDKEYLDRANEGNQHELVYFETALREKTVRLAENSDAICVFVNDSVTREVIESLVKYGIRAIVLRCAGFNNVDLESATRNHIRVLRVPAYSPNAVAEHAVALILTLSRKTHKAYNRVREGNFSIERLTGFELAGKTAGVIGTGKIGATFASIMKGFGCEVIAYDTFPDKALIASGVRYLSLVEVFRSSDIISLHCPLTPETYRMINKNTLDIMKKGVMLINTSRGKLIDTDAAIESLKEGRLGYLGIDVYEQEEKLFFKDLSEILILDDKILLLMTFPNVLVTAHQAYFTDKALTQIADTTIRNFTDLEKGTLNPANLVGTQQIKS